MNSRSVRSATLGIAVVAVAIGAAIPAVSATPVHIDADETFEGSGSTFTSTIEGCSSGTVSNGPFRIGGGPGTDFGNEGSTGTWAIVDGWDGYEDLHGAGTLVGTPTSTGINDVYDGTLRP
jgi:hypothetical protein